MSLKNKNVIDVKNLSVKLPTHSDRKYAVEDVSFSIAPNEIVCIAGESGSGKSVTAQAIMGLLQYTELVPTQGEIWLDNMNLLELSHKQMLKIQGVKIGMIFQEPMTALNPVIRVGHQINEILQIHSNLNQSQRYQKVISLMESVNLPDPEKMYRAFPHQLSGGQRQRVMIAIALALGPDLLIADEPTTALDVTTQAKILDLIKKMQQKHGNAVLFITHDFGVIAEIADRIIVMKDGRIVEQGKTEEILNNPQQDYTKMLIEAVPSLDPPEIVRKISDVVDLEVKDLRKSYGKKSIFSSRSTLKEVLKGIDFDIKVGETVGLVGETGAGKTTLARCIMRLVEPDEGELRIFGQNLADHTIRSLRQLHKDVQFIFQDPYRSLNPRLTVGQSIIEGPTNFGVPKSEALKQAADLLEVVGLTPDALNRYPHQFSGGQRQRICIARALAVRPKVLIADEPVSALDVSIQAQVLHLLADIRDKFGLAILFITHDLRVAAQVCDRILVLDQGLIVEEGLTSKIFNSPQHPYTKELIAAVPGVSRLP